MYVISWLHRPRRELILAPSEHPALDFIQLDQRVLHLVAAPTKEDCDGGGVEGALASRVRPSR